MQSEGEKALEAPVFCDGAYKSFGQMTVVDVRLRGEELGEVGSWGPLAKAAGVAAVWRELAGEMTRFGATEVRDLEPKSVLEFARRLWVVPPRGSLL